jgi:hypothetical protein
MSITHADQVIDAHTAKDHGELKSLPRKPGALNKEIEKRKVRWETPVSDDPDLAWPVDLVNLERLLVSRAAKDLLKVATALDEGTLKLVPV